ncbi:MAG: hypothetical protein QOC95_854 [Thermoleophilaceae bacterium]|jgi:methyl-accepting chemotaxis protein|nr:hypothetical protein [Thermoleophilaceae bacterium]
MWNPLSVPLALLGVAAGVPRALADLSRAVLLLEQAVAQAAALNETGEEARRLLVASLERVDQLNERGDLVLAELAEARETFAEAMERVDRLGEQGALVLAAIEATRPTAERIADHAEPMVAAAQSASAQLRETQAELERANEQVARALEMAEPLDRMTSRAQKLAGTLRRDP